MTSLKSIRVLLVEDNELFLLGLDSYLRTQADIAVVGQARDGIEAVTLFSAVSPDVVLADLRMPNLDGLSLISALLKLDARAKVLILTHYQGEEDIVRALRAGALGYLTKDMRGDDIASAIRIVAAGKRFVPAEVAEKLAESLSSEPLSLREREVLKCLTKGLSNRQIATELGLAERTAATYVSHLLWKLGVKSRAAAIVVATQRGLVKLD